MIIVEPRMRDGTAGYHIVTPFVRSDSTMVLVDCGSKTAGTDEGISKSWKVRQMIVTP